MTKPPERYGIKPGLKKLYRRPIEDNTFAELVKQLADKERNN